MRRPLAGLALACAAAVPMSAQALNISALSQNGWFSDDTRSDGTVVLPSGTNLIGKSLTASPEGVLGSLAHDTAILSQINFAPATGVPAGTHAAAVHLNIATSVNPGKSQISHRKDDGIGHGPGSSFGAGFTAQYSWMGNGNASITASLKFGLKTSEFGLAPISTRTGENAWDKLLIYEPGDGNGGVSDGLWHTETINFTTGKWWIVDRTVVGGTTIGSPMTLSAMGSSPVLIGGGPKTVANVYALITAPGAIITSVQFGIGSFNAGGSVYVNQMQSSAYRSNQVITFGTPALSFDQNVMPDAIYGGGNANGFFTVHRASGVELGMRGKLRYPAANIFKSNGDGTYTFNTGSGTGPLTEAEWSFEYSVNTDWAGTNGDKLNELSYQIGIDHDPSAGTNYAAFDVITPNAPLPFSALPSTPYWDHSIGTNATPNGGGLEAVDGATYTALLSTGNVAQQSWRMTFYDLAPFPTFNPNVPGRYDFYLAAFNGATELARTQIAILALNGTSVTLEADTTQADLFPGTPGVQVAVNVWLRNPADVAVTGHQEFLQFNNGAMTYVGALSSYTATPFASHIQPIATAEVAPGKLRLDGNSFPALTGTSGDALLATLVFTVSECSLNSVDFDLGQPFPTQLSNLGLPLATALLDSPDVLADNTAPVLAPHANITQPADAGSCSQAVVFFTAPSATDNCDASPTVVCSPASGSTFPVGTTVVTCTATDDCGNSSVSTFNVTVTPTNFVDVVVNLTGSGPTTRCIRFQMDSCSAATDVLLNFTGSNPAVATATIEVPCGSWTKICAKDRQHTKWDDTLITDAGANYVGNTTLVLDGGDTDNDGDVDINDVTLFLSQFGTTPASGGCPWNGTTRSADFSNNGPVGSEDYAFLVFSWLTTSSCPCTVSLPAGEGGNPRLSRGSIVAHDEVTRSVDFNRDGLVDYRDVALFEAQHGLSGELSEQMRNSER